VRVCTLAYALSHHRWFPHFMTNPYRRRSL
jgi:hypothetical protein